MCHTIDTPDFLMEVVTPGTYTEEDRRELRDLAVHLLVDNQRLQRAGCATRMHLLLHVHPALDHAVKVGWDRDDMHAAADREYGQWLIDNAGR
ncbi:hypothetical protein ACF09Y_22285 [Streptomyces massasporeus]|uniref:hypothetical protein n=1 Tax=Streptomyces massasporeus TaxID=67324 RepID=UPI0036F7EBBE